VANVLEIARAEMRIVWLALDALEVGAFPLHGSSRIYQRPLAESLARLVSKPDFADAMTTRVSCIRIASIFDAHTVFFAYWASSLHRAKANRFRFCQPRARMTPQAAIAPYLRPGRLGLNPRAVLVDWRHDSTFFVKSLVAACLAVRGGGFCAASVRLSRDWYVAGHHLDLCPDNHIRTRYAAIQAWWCCGFLAGLGNRSGPRGPAV
jgi:hypothetical protein